MNRQKIVATLRKYKRMNAHKYGILELGVFGSVARNSDIPGHTITLSEAKGTVE